MPPSSANVVLVVSSTTVVTEPDEMVLVTGITTAAVVDAGAVVDELLADGTVDWLAVWPFAIDESVMLRLAVVRAGLGGKNTPVGPAYGDGPVAGITDEAFGKTPEVPGVVAGKPVDATAAEMEVDSDELVEVETFNVDELDASETELSVALIAPASELLLDMRAGPGAVCTVLVLNGVTIAVVVMSVVPVKVVVLPVPRK